MKIKLKEHSNEAEFFDDEGGPLLLTVAELHIHVLPMEMVKCTMTVYVSEADIEIDDEYLTTKRKLRP